MSTQTTQITKKPPYFNYGRFKWKAEFPKSMEEIRNADDETIIEWFRFLPPGIHSNYKNELNKEVKRELFRRFR